MPDVWKALDQCYYLLRLWVLLTQVASDASLLLLSAASYDSVHRMIITEALFNKWLLWAISGSLQGHYPRLLSRDGRRHEDLERWSSLWFENEKSLRGSHCKPLSLDCGSISKAIGTLREEVLLEEVSHYGQVWVQPKSLPAFCHVKQQPLHAPVAIDRAVPITMPSLPWWAQISLKLKA